MWGCAYVNESSAAIDNDLMRLLLLKSPPQFPFASLFFLRIYDDGAGWGGVVRGGGGVTVVVKAAAAFSSVFPSPAKRETLPDAHTKGQHIDDDDDDIAATTISPETQKK